MGDEPARGVRIIGDVGYVVFPCGRSLKEGNSDIRLYYGAGTGSIALGMEHRGDPSTG